MSFTHTTLSNELAAYLRSVSLREPDVLRRLREETAGLEHARMQITPEQGQFMRLLLEILNARQVLEVGVFTGYSSLSMALALPPDGKIIACDISEEWTAIARRYWKEGGVEGKIDLRLAPALETLTRLESESGPERFDFAFIDADKVNYLAYYEHALSLLRPGGVIAVDNVLWSGRPADETNHDEDTVAIREFNLALRDDRRVSLSMVPIGDGLTLARKESVRS